MESIFSPGFVAKRATNDLVDRCVVETSPVICSAYITFLDAVFNHFSSEVWTRWKTKSWVYSDYNWSFNLYHHLQKQGPKLDECNSIHVLTLTFLDSIVHQFKHGKL